MRFLLRVNVKLQAIHENTAPSPRFHGGGLHNACLLYSHNILRKTSFSSPLGLILSSCASNSQYNGSHTGPQYWHALESRPAPCISLTWIRRLPTSSALSRTLNMIFINRVLPYVLYAMAFPYFNPCSNSE